jgi:diguanylate cyclase (GGDEF)-like protein
MGNLARLCDYDIAAADAIGPIPDHIVPPGELDGILTLARVALDAPAALLTLNDGATVVAACAEHLDCGAVAQDGAFYNLAAQANTLLIVGDAALDSRFDGKRLGEEGAPIRFCASAPLDEEAAIGALTILDVRPRRLERPQIELMQQMARAAALRLRASPQARAAVRAAQAGDPSSGARYKKMFERASALARIGVWECNLADGALTWTDGVYDIFELPRGSALERARIVELYTDESRAEMERLRARAIAERGSFCVDVQIRTAKGNMRWMRLSADVECEAGEPVRIFGLKQDITQEKDLLERLQRLAECDPLTGIANRGVFHASLEKSFAAAPEDGGLAALLVLDLDGFKQINDTFGHLAGDECLKEVAGRLETAFPSRPLVARIGGDEFALLVVDPQSRDEVERAARALVEAIRKPVAWSGQACRIGASIGVAIPDATTTSASQLFSQADIALYAAKNAGRNTFRVFNPLLAPQARREETPYPGWF